MSTSINDAVKQAEQALDKKESQAKEVEPSESVTVSNSKEPETPQMKEDPLLLSGESDSNEDTPVNPLAEKLNSLSTKHKAMIVLGVMVAVVIFGPSPSKEVSTPAEIVPSATTEGSEETGAEPLPIEDILSVGEIDESFETEMVIIPAPNEDLNFGIEGSNEIHIPEDTDKNTIDDSDIISVDLLEENDPVNLVEQENEDTLDPFNLEDSNVETLVFQGEDEPEAHDILGSQSPDISTSPETEAIELDLPVDQVDSTLTVQDDALNKNAEVSDIDTSSTEETSTDNTPLMAQIKAQNALLERLADKIDNLESKTPGKDYHYAPNVDLLYVAPASRHCQECVDHAVLMYKGDKVHVANNEQFIGYKVVLENNRLKLSKNGVEHSYFPIKE